MRLLTVGTVTLLSIGAVSILGCGKSASNQNVRRNSAGKSPTRELPVWSGTLAANSDREADLTVHYLYDEYRDNEVDLTPAAGQKLIGLDMEFAGAKTLEDVFPITEKLVIVLGTDKDEQTQTRQVELNLLSSEVAFFPLSARGLKTTKLDGNRLGIVLVVPADTSSIGLSYEGRALTSAKLQLGTGPLVSR